MSMQTLTKPKRKRGVRNVAFSECAYCGETAARQVELPQAYRGGDELIVIDKVPALLCDSCGQCYITDATWAMVDEVLRHPEKHTKNKMVKVATYP